MVWRHPDMIFGKDSSALPASKRASEHEPCEAHLGWPFLWFVTGRIAAIFQGKASNLPVKKIVSSQANISL
jgi:hypothetical protein